MAHQITKNDRQEGIEQAWHGLTVIREDLSLRDNWLREHDVAPAIVYAGGEVITLPDGRTALVGFETPGQSMLFSDGIAVGGSFNPDSYTPISNRMILDMLEASLEGVGHKVVSVGTYRNRAALSVTISLDTMPDYIAGKRNFKAFLNLLSSHDQTVPVRVSTSNTCVVCANTYAAALRDVPMAVVRHSKNALEKIPGMSKTIDAAIGVQAEFARAMDEFDGIGMTENVARPLFAGFIAPSDAERLSTRASGSVDRLTQLFRNGAGNDGRTLADAFSAFTDFYSHESSGGENRAKQYLSSEYGTASVRKQEAFKVCQNRKGELDATIARGSKLLMAA